MYWRQALTVTLFVLAIRLPFLDQPIQGDDIYYLYGAQHAQIEPLHPRHTQYPFQGDVVSMQGHPHPPFNAAYLGALLALTGDIHERAYHLAYIPFSLIAALSALSIARRSTQRPLAATLLFCTVPAFVVNGMSLESDLPLLAFFLLGTALYLAEKHFAAAAALVAAGMCGYQAVVLLPILFLYRKRPLWVLAAMPAALGAWEIWERVSTGAMPAQVLAGYFDTYGLQRLENKLRNAAALTVHMAWIVCPAAIIAAYWRKWMWAVVPACLAAWYDPNPLCWVSVFAGVLLLCSLPRREWLGQWALLFFAASLVLFFAGSARYLLPLALPICILMATRTGWWAVAANGALGLALAAANYQHWDAYRRIAATLKNDVQEKRVWVNGEWGLRFYLESEGALPLLRNQAVQPGEMVVTSALADPIRFTTGGGVPAVIRQTEIRTAIPLRLNALHSRSAYSTAARGIRPFDISNEPNDIVTVTGVAERKPTLTYLLMGSEEATSHIVSGVHDLEGNQWRWTTERAVLLLKSPEKAAPILAKIFLHGNAPGRHVTIAADNTTLLDVVLPSTGSHTLTTEPYAPGGPQTQVVITIDKTFQVGGDNRRLGLILAEVGFQTP